ncbi:MAG: hypothetical protein MJ135_06485 [Oscillospiraceae bacterium]|nr:hypothetical protein [Oscillospiraceae bacterium]
MQKMIRIIPSVIGIALVLITGNVKLAAGIAILLVVILNLIARFFFPKKEEVKIDLNQASPEQLASAAKTSQDATFRLAAAQQLDSQEVWKYMVENDADNALTAICSCSDAEFLKALYEKDPGSEKKPVLLAQLNKLTDRQYLVSMNSCEGQEELLAFILQDLDEDPAWRFLSDQGEEDAKLAALERISDPAVLEQIASRSPNEFIADEAKEKLQNM